MRGMVFLLLMAGPAMAADYSGFSPEEFTSQVDEKPTEGMALGHVQEAFMRAGEKDNVRHIAYAPSKTPKVRTRFGMATTIILDEQEVIEEHLLSNRYFKLLPVSGHFKHAVIIQPLFEKVDANLTLFGASGTVYSFYLFADPVTSEHVPDLKIYVSASLSATPSPQYTPETTNSHFLLSEEQEDYLKTLGKAEGLNVHYKLYGDEEVAPHGVYDDGKWTYFDYRKKLTSDRTPVIYKVVDGIDVIVNSRAEGGLLIAETLSPEGWTVRNGKKTLCVKPTQEIAVIHGEKKASFLSTLRGRK